MSEDLVYYSMIVVILVAALTMLAANIHYILAAFRYRFEEGLAGLAFAIAGYILFLLSKLRAVPLSEIVLSLFADSQFEVLAAIIPAGLAGWLVGLFYAWQMKKRTFRSFRWALLLVSVIHGVLIDFVLILASSRNSPSQGVMLASSAFVFCVLITWAANVHGEARGNVLDDYPDNRGGSEPPSPHTQNPDSSRDDEHPRFPF